MAAILLIVFKVVCTACAAAGGTLDANGTNVFGAPNDFEFCGKLAAFTTLIRFLRGGSKPFFSEINR